MYKHTHGLHVDVDHNLDLAAPDLLAPSVSHRDPLHLLYATQKMPHPPKMSSVTHALK